MLKACLTMLTWYMILGRIGKVVTSHAAVAKSILAAVAPIYTMHEVLRGYCQGRLQLQAWVLTKWSPINSYFFHKFLFFISIRYKRYTFIMQSFRTTFADTQDWSCRRPWYCQ